MIPIAFLAAVPVAPDAYADGYTGRPLGGTVPYPTLLAGYAHPPPWHVPGTGTYTIGADPTTATTDWQTLSGTGITVQTGGGDPYVKLTGVDNFTFQDIDFSLHNGARLWIVDSNNTFVGNCIFGGSAMGAVPTGLIFVQGTGGGTAVVNNTMDCVGGSPTTQAWAIGNQGDLTFEYNHVFNASNEYLSNDNVGGACTLTIRYNAFGPANLDARAHQNWFQSVGAGSTATIDIEFNLFYENSPDPSGFTGGREGIQFYNNVAASGVDNCTFANNTFVVLPSGGNPVMSNVCRGPNTAGFPTTVTGTNLVNENYVDISGAAGTMFDDTGGTPWVGFTSTVPNVRMVSGATEPFPSL